MKTKPGDALVLHAHARTDQVRMKLRDAMKVIELEIEQNNGIYPFHGGRLSLSEVCRRAGVHKVTLQGASHRESSKPMVENWIEGLRARLITGRKTVRKTVTARADDWEERYKSIANKFNEMYAIDVIAKDKTIRELTDRVEMLEAENLRLQAALSEGKVIRLPTKMKNGATSPANKKADEANLVLIRGVPGSGKSTLASTYKGYAHFEADMYFIRDGVYAFDPDLLPAAHQWCLQNTRDALDQGTNVVVSNTFLCAWEIKPYIDLMYPFKIVDANGEWPSIHGVDVEKIKLMRSSWVSSERIIQEVMALST
jgi:predicted kinase